MKAVFFSLAFAAAALAQDLSSLPTCSLECLTKGVQSVGCGLTDTECACKKTDEMTAKVTPCILKACDQADQAKLLEALGTMCKTKSGGSYGEPAAEAPPAPSAPATSAAPVTSAKPVGSAAPPSQAPPAQTSESSPAPYTSNTPEQASTSGPSTCAPVTVTVTMNSAMPPYPTGTGVPAGLSPSGTGVGPNGSPLAEYSGAAVAANVPAGFAGILGLAAFFL